MIRQRARSFFGIAAGVGMMFLVIGVLAEAIAGSLPLGLDAAIDALHEVRMTPLAMAAVAERSDVIRALVDRGADPGGGHCAPQARAAGERIR